MGLERIVNGILNVVYPESIYCIGCGAIIDKTRPYSLCDACREKFIFAVGKTCARCGRILSDDYPHLLCSGCMEAGENPGDGGAHAFERGYTCLMYGLYEKEMIKAFKYHNRPYYSRHLGEMMYDRIEPERLDIDMVVPVPLHPKKLKKRGYNQAELLAREVARRMGKPMLRALVRTAYTKPMSRVKREERSGNLVHEVQERRGSGSFGSVHDAHRDSHYENVFQVPPRMRKPVRGSRILLIDDIYTTGATADAGAAALRDAGSAEVFLLTLAAGGNPPPHEPCD